MCIDELVAIISDKVVAEIKSRYGGDSPITLELNSSTAEVDSKYEISFDDLVADENKEVESTTTETTND